MNELDIFYVRSFQVVFQKLSFYSAIKCRLAIPVSFTRNWLFKRSNVSCRLLSCLDPQLIKTGWKSNKKTAFKTIIFYSVKNTVPKQVFSLRIILLIIQIFVTFFQQKLLNRFLFVISYINVQKSTDFKPQEMKERKKERILIEIMKERKRERKKERKKNPGKLPGRSTTSLLYIFILKTYRYK